MEKKLFKEPVVIISSLSDDEIISTSGVQEFNANGTYSDQGKWNI